MAITRHGDTVGYFIPARRKRTEADRATFNEASDKLRGAFASLGMSEDEVLEDFKRWRRSGKE